MSRRRLQGRASLVARLAVVALCVLWLVPAIGILLTSVRTPDAVNSSGWWTMFRLPFDPSQLTFASYRQAWNMGLGFSFLNSLAVTLPAVAIPVVIAGTAAYAFTFLQFPGRDVLFVVIVGLLIALLYLGEGDRQVITVTLGGVLGGNQLLGWQVVTGAAVITMAVPVLVFVTLQRYFVQGLTAGSVGG